MSNDGVLGEPEPLTYEQLKAVADSMMQTTKFQDAVFERLTEQDKSKRFLIAACQRIVHFWWHNRRPQTFEEARYRRKKERQFDREVRMKARSVGVSTLTAERMNKIERN